MSSSYREYDRLAQLYDRYWGREYPEAAAKALDALLFPEIPPAGSILDLCCGAGHVTKGLCERNLQVTGVDGSLPMLNFARGNAPGAAFIAADARYLFLRRRFDAVISTFEAMNHILRKNELRLVFEGVSGLLSEGGSFLFDVLTQQAYCEEWVKSSSIIDEDAVCIMHGGYEPETGNAHVDITAFLRDEDQWRRLDTRVHERWYPLDVINILLRDSGFGIIRHYDACSLGITGTLAVGREFILAKK